MARSQISARRRLGAALRDLRQQAGLKIENAADKLECSNSKVSRLENGKGVPRRRDINDLIDLYGAPAEARRAELLALVEEGTADESLTTSYRDVLEGDMVNDDVRRYWALEQDARSISSFEVDYVPGVLQTAEYTDALARLADPDRSDEQRSRFVALRQERRAMLLERLQGRGDPVELHFVVLELALRRPVGGEALMRRQLEAITELLAGPLAPASFRIAPNDLVQPAVFGGPFTVLEFADERDQDVVYLEGRASAQYLETDHEVKRFKQLFQELDAVADAQLVPRLEALLPAH